MTHQDLLNRYTASALAGICERSAAISDDARAFRGEVREYAQENGLTVLEDLFNVYIPEEA